MADRIPTITVNGEPVPPQAIEHELSRLVQFYSQHMPEAEVRNQLDALRSRAVEQAIGSKLLFDEAARLDIAVPEAEIDQSVFRMAKEIGGMEKLRAQLKKQGLSEAALREQFRRGKKVDKLVESIVSAAGEPTEEECRDHFEAHRDEYAKGERVLAQHILITPKDGSDEAKKAARDKLGEIRARVVAGADFGDEATAHSDCPSGKNGGSLGWFSRGMMVPAFEKAAFDMEVGQVSDIIETQFGYHIIYKTDAEAATAADFDDAKDSVRDFLYHSKRGELLSKHVAELRKAAKIEIH